jgi:hypothetical protein
MCGDEDNINTYECLGVVVAVVVVVVMRCTVLFTEVTRYAVMEASQLGNVMSGSFGSIVLRYGYRRPKYRGSKSLKYLAYIKLARSRNPMSYVINSSC